MDHVHLPQELDALNMREMVLALNAKILITSSLMENASLMVVFNIMALFV